MAYEELTTPIQPPRKNERHGGSHSAESAYVRISSHSEGNAPLTVQALCRRLITYEKAAKLVHSG